MPLARRRVAQVSHVPQSSWSASVPMIRDWPEPSRSAQVPVHLSLAESRSPRSYVGPREETPPWSSPRRALRLGVRSITSACAYAWLAATLLLSLVPAAVGQVVPGDFDLGEAGQSTAIDVDLADFAVLQRCFGPLPQPPPDGSPCGGPIDLNYDFVGDLTDHAFFACGLRGPDVNPEPVIVLDAYPADVILPTVTLSGTAGAAPQVKILGGPQAVTANVIDCHFTAQITLQPGVTNNLALTGVFWNSVPTPAVYADITHHLPPPAPTLNAHTTMTNQSTVIVTGTAPQAVSVSVNSPGGMMTGIAVTNGTFTANVMLAPNQVNQVYFTSIGALGLASAPAATAITHDQQPPELFIDFPADGAMVTTPAIDVAGRVSDMLSGFNGLNVCVCPNGAMPDAYPCAEDCDAPCVCAAVNIGIGTNGTYFAPAIPLSVGINTITVAAADTLGNSTTRQITVTRTEIPPGAPVMEVVSGNGQSGQVLTPLAEPIVVKITHASGMPFVNKVVTFHVTQSDGRLGETASAAMNGSMMFQTHTDANGLAQAFWRLGGDAGMGNNRVEVTSTDVVGTTVFCASATPGLPSQINIGSGNNQRGEVGAPLPLDLEVRVSDGCNGVPGAEVEVTVVSGGGSVNGSNSVIVFTSATGHAQVSFVLGPNPGSNVVRAVNLANPQGPAATFNAVGVVRVPQQPTSLEALVLDNAGQPIQGATCSLVAGGTTVPDVLTDVHGQCRWGDLPVFGAAELTVNGLTATHIGGPAMGDPPTCPGCQDVPAGSFPSVPFQIVIVPNAANSLPAPARLPRLNPANARAYSATQDTVLTVEGVKGLKFTVKAGSMFLAVAGQPSSFTPAPDGTVISLNPVHHDDIPMPIPDGAAPAYAGTLQPRGAKFVPPIAVEYPNMYGLPAGTITNFMSFNHDTGEFEIIASGPVSDDGSTISTFPGDGIDIAGWHCNCPPYAVTGDCCKKPTSNGCGSQDGPDFVPDCPLLLAGCLSPCLSDGENGPCDHHDVCWGTCPPSGVSAQAWRNMCDAQFFNEIASHCATCLNPLGCLELAYIYYAGVHFTQQGNNAFDSAQAACCPEDPNRGGGAPPGGPITPPYVDEDDDLLPDDWELQVGLDPSDRNDAAQDPDGDGLSNLAEFVNQTSPFTADTDGDGLDDFSEVQEAQPIAPPAVDSTWALVANGQVTTASAVGSFHISNVSAPDFLPATGVPDMTSDECVQVFGTSTADGVTRYAYSEAFRITQGESYVIQSLTVTDTPVGLIETLNAAADDTLLTPGQTTQLQVTAVFSNGASADVTFAPGGDCAEVATTYLSSNPAIVSVQEDSSGAQTGLLTADGVGTAFITVTNQGATVVERIDVAATVVQTTIEGFLQLEDGTPVEGATVSVQTYEADPVVSASDGSFAIPLALPGGVSNVLLQAAGMVGSQAYAGLKSVVVMPNAITDAGIFIMGDRCDGEIALPIAYGDTVTWSFAPDCQTLHFEFDGEPGDAVLIVYAGAPSAKPLKLLSPGGGVIATSGTGNGNLLSITDAVLPANGTYTIIVEANNSSGEFGLSLTAQGVGAPITPNTPTNGVMDLVADVDEYLFTGTAGTYVTVNWATSTVMNNPDVFARIELVRPSGTIAASTSAGCGTTSLQLSAVPLFETGTWSVRVRPADNWTNCYGVLLDVLTGGYTLSVCPSNTPPQPVAYGQPTAGTFTTQCQIANFTFEGEVGDVVLVMYTGLASARPIKLLAPGGGVIASSGSSNGNLLTISEVVLPATGDYLIAVEANNSTGDFGVGVTAQGIGVPITAHEPTGGSISAFAEIDGYTFTGTAGASVTVNWSTPLVIGNPDIHARLDLVRPSGTIAASTSAGCGSNSLQLSAVPLFETGAWTVRLRIADNWTSCYGALPSVLTGGYTLTVCPSDTPAQSISYGQSVSGNFVSPCQTANFTFMGQAGDVVLILYTGLASARPLKLISPDGGLIATSGTSNGNLLSIADTVLPATGVYRIVAESNNSTGEFGLGLTAQAIGTPITANTPTNGTLNALAEMDGYTFTGMAGTTVTVNWSTSQVAGNPDVHARLELVRPSGTVAASTTAGCGNNSLQLNAVPLFETGTWTVRVRAGDNWTSCYGVFPVVLTGAYTLTVCPSNTPPLAMTYGQPVTGSFTAQCQIVNFTFTGQAGDVVLVVYTGSPSARPLKLLAPGGGVIATSGTSNGNLLSIADTVLPATGTYTVVVEANNSTGDFGMSVTAQAIGVPITINVPTAGLLTTLAEVDGHTFTGTAGTAVSVNWSAPSVAGNPDVHARLDLVRPSGTIAASTTAGCGANSLQLSAIPLFETGTWTVRVRTGENWTSCYGVFLDVLTGAYTLSVCPSNTQPQAITYGQSAAGSFTTQCQTANFTFLGAAGDVVLVVYTGSPSARPVKLLSPDGGVIATSGPANGNLLSIVDAALPTSGTYRIVVEANNSAGAFGVGLAAQGIGVPITPNMATPGSLDAFAEIDGYTFFGTAGSTVTVNWSTPSVVGNPDVFARLELVRPSGTVATNTAVSCGATTQQISAFALSETGTWTLRVRTADNWTACYGVFLDVLTGVYTVTLVQAVQVGVQSANPPADNPFVTGQQPFVDVLDTGTSTALTAGIGGAGTQPEGPISYSPIGVTFSGTPSPAPTIGNVMIACTGAPAGCPTVTGVSGSGAGPYSITLSGAIPPGQCTTLTFAGTTAGTKLQYQSQPGNVNMDALTNTQDLLALIIALNNGAANLPTNLARYNINRSTGASPVNTQDLLRLIQLLNGTNTTQAFNGAGVAACP